MPLFRRRQRSNSILLVAVGAVAGLVLGVVIAERTGGVEGLLKGRGGRGGRRLPRQDGWRSESRGHGGYTPEDDDEHELAPESISHMHVRGGYDDIDDSYDIEELEELEERVLEAFRNDPILAERAIDIGAVDGDTVELTGWVHSPSEIGHALTLARGVPGVEAVVDRLAVRVSNEPRNHSGEQYTDAPVPGES